MDTFTSVCSNGDILLQWLIAAGVEVDRKDKYEYTALMIASQGGLEGLVSILLEHGADPNILVKMAPLIY